MNKSKKLLSLLLVLAMVFSLAVPVFAEGETTASKVDSIAAGDKVVIYSAKDGKVATNTEKTYNSKQELVVADATVTDGTMTLPEDAAVLTVSVDANGKYSFVNASGKYLYMDSSDVKFVDEAGDNTLFQLETADGGFYIKADTANYNGKAQYLEYYAGCFTVFGMNSSNTAIYTFQFFKVNSSAAENTYEGKTVILHSNDVHGAIDGYAYMAGLAAQYEAQGAEVIIADAGDYMQGQVAVSRDKGQSAVNMMNTAGYDISTVGNHEFDYGYENLKTVLSSANFDVVCCNIVDDDGNPVFDASKVITTESGLKIGVIGVNTPETQTKANPKLVQGLNWLSGDEMTAAVQAEADKLADSTDIIIVLAHLGVDGESEPNRSTDVWAGLKEGSVDFIIDGHSHTVMTAGDNGEPIQSTGTAFANIGVIVIDNESKAIESNSLVAVSDITSVDETVKAASDAINAEVDADYGEVFAQSEVELTGAKAYSEETGLYGNRDGETNMGDFVTDAMLWKIDKEGAVTDVDADHIVAITNGGGLRAAIGIGDVTKKDINTVLPFGNTLTVVYVTGAELLEALEASTFCADGSPLGGYPQIAGMNITINLAKEYDANEETYPSSTYYGPASINRVTIDSVNGQEFSLTDTYAVVTNNFCAAGGDTYYAFAAATTQVETGFPLDEVVMEYVTEELNGVISAEQYGDVDGRIVYEYEPFSDIDGWYHDEICYAHMMGIAEGYQGMFYPTQSVTREQFVTMLYRLTGGDDTWSDYTFNELTYSDAADISDYAVKAVQWATDLGLVNGRDGNNFAPKATATRAEAVTMLYRLFSMVCEANGQDVSSFYYDCGFSDVVLGSWYEEAVNVMANVGIVNGGDNNQFLPMVTTDRAQAACFCVRIALFMSELFGGEEATALTSIVPAA